MEDIFRAIENDEQNAACTEISAIGDAVVYVDPMAPQLTRATVHDFTFDDEGARGGSTSPLDPPPPAQEITLVSILMPLQMLKVVHLVDSAKGLTRWTFKPDEGAVMISSRLDVSSSVVVALRGNQMLRWETTCDPDSDTTKYYSGDVKNCAALFKCLSLGTRLGNYRVKITASVRNETVERFRFVCLDHAEESRGSTDILTCADHLTADIPERTHQHGPDHYSKFGWVTSKELVTALRAISFSPRFRISLDAKGLVFSSVLRESFQCEAPVKLSCAGDASVRPFTESYECRSLGALIRILRTQTRIVFGVPSNPSQTAVYFGIHVGPCTEPATFFSQNMHSGQRLQESHVHFYIHPTLHTAAGTDTSDDNARIEPCTKKPRRG